MTREQLICQCHKAIVPYEKWINLDTPEALLKVGELLVLLLAGCQFKILTEQDGGNCITDERTIWVKIKHWVFEQEEKWQPGAYYLPTDRRLAEASGDDWY